MKCSKCGKEYEGNFCPYCGTPANPEKELCPVCGKEREEGKRYCRNCGHDFYSVSQKSKNVAAGAIAKIKAVPKKVWIIAAAAIVIIAVVITLCVVLSNKFRLGVVERIQLGASKEEVIDILGEPYDYDEDDSVFTYFSDNYRKLLEENDNFNPDDIEDWEDFENAFGDALELEQKLQTEEYQYIEVRFDSEGTVTSVFFDAARTEQTKNQAKTIERYDLLSDTSDYLTIADGIQYSTHYTDGSYYIGTTSINLNTEGEVFTIEWRDNYGNTYEYPMSENSIGNSIYDASTHTLQIFTNNGFRDVPEDVENVIIYDGVTTISDSAFEDCTSLTSIIIPDSVTSIGVGAFAHCTALTSIIIPDNVTSIGVGAFAHCTALTSVTIGNGVSSIGYEAFYNCTSLTTITIPDGVTSIGSQAFSGCDSLTKINIPDGVTSIGSSAFNGCDSLNYNSYDNALYLGNDTNPYVVLIRAKDYNINSCTIYSQTKVIYKSAFEDCTSLTSIIIPDSVTSIGWGAFYNCYSLTSINIPDSVTSIGGSAFSNCYSLTGITIPDSVTSIGELAFSGCSNIVEATIPTLAIDYIPQNSLQTVIITSGTSIGYGAFSGCDSLASITIPDSVTSIGTYAFENCTSLTSITIPDSITSIGREAFSGCSSIASITVDNNNSVYHSDGNCLIETAKKTLIFGCQNSIIPDDGSVTTIGDSAFRGCSSLTSITIPDSITFIGSWAFYECNSLTRITVSNNNSVYHSDGNCLIETATKTLIFGCQNSIIPDDGSVTSIGVYAFRGCTSLTSITIPDSVTTIGTSAFYQCTALTNISIGDGVTSIGNHAFESCYSLTSVTIGDSVTTIGNSAFSRCTSLTNVTIPDSVTSISNWAFSYCDSLETVYYTGTEEQWNEINIQSGNSDLTDANIIYNYEE